MTPDPQLLRQYAEHHDDAAFAELVRRHIDLVYSVALRQANGDTHLAEDATQAVFTDLARKARSLSGRETLSGWLHTSARFAAGNAVRGEARRRVREHEAVTMHELTSAPDVNWDHLRPLLDESVGQLKEADRDAIVLRFFEGKSHEEIGKIFGLSENSANKRVERALEKLRENFQRRGVKASSALLATVIAENSVQAAPAELAANVTTAALAGVGSAAAGSAFLITFFTFMSTQTKLLVASVVLVAVVSTLALNWPSAASKSVDSQPGSTASLPLVKAVPNTPVVVQVEMPVAAAVVPAKSPATSTDSAAVVATTFVAGPQADLKTAILTGIHFLEAGDVPSVLRTLMPPDELTGHNGPTGLPETVEDYAQGLSKDRPDMMANIAGALRAVQDLTPILSPDGKSASYILDQPISSDFKKVDFENVDGFWYLK